VRNYGDHFRARERQVGIPDGKELVPEREDALAVDVRDSPIGADAIVARQELHGDHVAGMQQRRVTHFRRKMAAARNALQRLKSELSQLRRKMVERGARETVE